MSSALETEPFGLANMHVIVLAGAVTQERCDRIAHAAINAVNDGKDIALVVETVGGKGLFGLFVHHLLRALPCDVTTINMGLTASAGNYIYLAGNKRLCVPGAQFGFHLVDGKPNKDVGDGAVADSHVIGQPNITMRDVFLDRTELDSAVVDSLVGEAGGTDVFKSVDWALNNGFVHEIVSSFRIPEGSCIISI